MNKLRIFLADDHLMIREGLKLMINSQPDMQVVGEAGDGRSAVNQAIELKPDVAVLDISMPQLNGLQATEALKQALPRLKVLILTRHTDAGHLQQLLHAGAAGYILKQSAADELIRALRAVIAGGTYLDPAVAAKAVSGMTGRLSKRSAEKGDALTERELEVLRLIAWGYSNKEIAARFDLSVKTVEAHKANAMSKLELRSRIDIVRYAILRGWMLDT
jgi:two-component system, NarL family, response regulator NreC